MATTLGFIGVWRHGWRHGAQPPQGRLPVDRQRPRRCQGCGLLARGAKAAASAAAVARQTSTTITMVETTAQTEEVILGVDGVIAGAQRGHVVAVMSTIDPNAANRLHDRLEAAGSPCSMHPPAAAAHAPRRASWP